MSERATILLLNGVGSVGKSSITTALQQIAERPLLHVQMDAFLEMLPETYWGHPDGYSFETHTQDGAPSVEIREGPVAARTMRGMRVAIAAMAAEGCDMIVDDVLLGAAGAEYARLLGSHELILVGVFAPLDVIEAREAERGDRMIGLARWQFDRVHQGLSYDLELDAVKNHPQASARLIKEKFSL